MPSSGGEGYVRWRERGWESPNSDEGTYTVVLFLYTYIVRDSILAWSEMLSELEFLKTLWGLGTEEE